MKTALQKLISILIEESEQNKENYNYNTGIQKAIKVAENLLKDEKQQIIESHNKGQQFYNPGYNPDTSEKYYNETFYGL